VGRRPRLAAVPAERCLVVQARDLESVQHCGWGGPTLGLPIQL
jgi:hypothetical protein